MTGRFLLDTNIIIDLFAGTRAVETGLGRAKEIFLPSIVVGELYFGARKSSRVSENLERINQLITRSPVLVCGVGTAREYGIIKNRLSVQGRPIPENDIWIAALAKQYGLILVTRDAHFNEIDGVYVEIW